MEIKDCSVDDLDEALDVRTRSFGHLAEANRERWRNMQARAIAERRLLAAHDGERLVATARINAYRQWWYGEALPMAGIAGVVVAPECRGQGVGRRLMSAVLARSRELGFAVSALFPATVPPYRAVGWELAGRQYIMTIAAEAIRTLAVGRPAGVRRVGAESAGAVRELLGALHARHRDLGPIEVPERDVAEWLGEDETFAYLTDDGFLGYRWSGSDLVIDTLVAGSEQSTRDLWSIVGSGSSVARTVRAAVPPDDPVRLLTREVDARTDREVWWMLRLVDAPAAMAGRGFAQGIEAEVALTVSDTQVSENSGHWLLRVKDGRGELVPSDRAGLEMSANGLAALYSGTRVGTLRRAGLVSGGGEDDALLDAVFTGTAFMLDYF